MNGTFKRSRKAAKRGKSSRARSVQRARRGLRSYARYRTPTAIQGAQHLFPEKKLVTFGYNQRFLLDNALATETATKVFRLSSLYDPDFDVSITNGSHQPFMFDQMAVFYDKYCVMGAKVTITAFARDTNVLNTSNIICAYFEDGSHTEYPTNPDALREKRYDGKKFAQLGSTNNSNLHPKKLVLKYSAKKFFSVSSMKDNLTTHGATTTSNPIKNAFLYIHLLNMYDGLKNFDPSEVFVNVNIQYTALMFDRRTIAQS